MALISGRHKIIFGQQQGRGIWFGPVYPNGTTDALAFPCADGCLFDIFEDPTEHRNLKFTLPELYEELREKLLALGKTLYQTDYAEPGTTDAEKNCISGPEARALYVGHNTCIRGGPGYHPSLPSCDETTPRYYLGPMCFKDGEKPIIPPPPPPPPALTICHDRDCTKCLATDGETWGALSVSACSASCERRWGFPSDSPQGTWIAWLPTSAFIKLDERPAHGGNLTTACRAGKVFVNPQDPPHGITSQGFSISNWTTAHSGVIQLRSSACEGYCLAEVDGQIALAPCAVASTWTVKEWRSSR